MLEDAQTQRLPESPAEMARLADFCGSRERRDFEAETSRARLETVAALTEPFFVPEARPADAPPPEAVFADPAAAEATMAAWRRLPALRSERARGIFRRLEPELLRRMAGAASPDAALASLDAFLSRLPAGVQIFSLMQANPPLLDLLIDICGSAPGARPPPRRQRRRPRRGDQPPTSTARSRGAAELRAQLAGRLADAPPTTRRR